MLTSLLISKFGRKFRCNTTVLLSLELPRALRPRLIIYTGESWKTKPKQKWKDPDPTNQHNKDERQKNKLC